MSRWDESDRSELRAELAALAAGVAVLAWFFGAVPLVLGLVALFALPLALLRRRAVRNRRAY